MIALALSGGIDSAVAAHLLKERGHSVLGLFMKHRYQRETEHDAVKAAEFLDIPLEIVDLSDAFEAIVEYFTETYFQGRTPNPCVRCNPAIKFGVLFDHAVGKLGASAFATGHYVRREVVDGSPALFRGVDGTKDQSYVLYGIDRRKLSRLHFPLGGLTKVEVKRLAERIGIPLTEKKESQDICFVENGRHSEFLRERRPEVDTSGRFVSPEGRVLALHGGFERFTVGQRKGMGVGFGQRIFVLRLDAETRDVTIGPWEDLARNSLTAAAVRWLLPEDPVEPIRCGVKIRYRCETAPVRVVPQVGDRVEVEFDEPQYGIAPGQSAVFYRGDRLLGGGVIELAER